MTKELPTIPWNTLPEGTVVCPAPSLWVVRIGVVVNRPRKEKKYEDSNVLLSLLEGDSNSVLGYMIQSKRDFDAVFSQDSYVSFLSDVKKAVNPVVLYKDQKVYLYRFNSTRTPSYWFLVRNRTTSSLPREVREDDDA